MTVAVVSAEDAATSLMPRVASGHSAWSILLFALPLIIACDGAISMNPAGVHAYGGSVGLPMYDLISHATIGA